MGVKTYRLSISGVVSYDEATSDVSIRNAFQMAAGVSLHQLESIREAACQELQETAGIDTIKITLEEILPK